MRKPLTLLPFVVLLVLSACGGSSGGEIACSQGYWDGTYGSCLPADWIVIDRETLRLRGVPEETVTAFQSEVATSGQFPTVAVTREALSRETTAQAYSDANVRAVTALPGYDEIDVKDITIDGESIKLHIFAAQPIPEEPLRRFYQVSTVSGDSGFTITGTTPVSVDESVESQVLLIIDNSTFEAPAEEE